MGVATHGQCTEVAETTPTHRSGAANQPCGRGPKGFGPSAGNAMVQSAVANHRCSECEPRISGGKALSSRKPLKSCHQVELVKDRYLETIVPEALAIRRLSAFPCLTNGDDEWPKVRKCIESHYPDKSPEERRNIYNRTLRSCIIENCSFWASDVLSRSMPIITLPHPDAALKVSTRCMRPKGFVGAISDPKLSNSDHLWAGYRIHQKVCVPMKVSSKSKRDKITDNSVERWKKWLVSQGATCFWHALVCLCNAKDLDNLDKLTAKMNRINYSAGIDEWEAQQVLRKSPFSVYVHNPVTGQVDCLAQGESGRGGVIKVYCTDTGKYGPHWLPVHHVTQGELHYDHRTLCSLVTGALQDGASTEWVKMLIELRDERNPNRNLLEEAFHGSVMLKTSKQLSLFVNYTPGKLSCARTAHPAPARPCELPAEPYVAPSAKPVHFAPSSPPELPMGPEDMFTDPWEYLNEGELPVDWDVYSQMCTQICSAFNEWRNRPKKKPVEKSRVQEVYGVDVPPLGTGCADWYQHNTVESCQGAIKVEGSSSLWPRRLWKWMTTGAYKTMVESRPEIIQSGVPVRPGSMIYFTEQVGVPVQKHRAAGGSVKLSAVAQVYTRDAVYEVKDPKCIPVNHYGTTINHWCGELRLKDTTWRHRLYLLFPFVYDTTTQLSLAPRRDQITKARMSAIPTREGRVRALALMYREKVNENRVGLINELRNEVLGNEEADVEAFTGALESLIDIDSILSGARPDMIRAYSYA